LWRESADIGAESSNDLQKIRDKIEFFESLAAVVGDSRLRRRPLPIEAA
jgi:hypothetical protein